MWLRLHTAVFGLKRHQGGHRRWTLCWSRRLARTAATAMQQFPLTDLPEGALCCVLGKLPLGQLLAVSTARPAPGQLPQGWDTHASANFAASVPVRSAPGNCLVASTSTVPALDNRVRRALSPAACEAASRCAAGQQGARAGQRGSLPGVLPRAEVGRAAAPAGRRGRAEALSMARAVQARLVALRPAGL